MQQAAAEKEAGEKNPDVLFTIAAVNMANGQYHKALQCIKELEELDPEYPGLWRLRAKVYELMGNPEMASECWDKGSDGHR